MLSTLSLVYSHDYANDTCVKLYRIDTADVIIEGFFSSEDPHCGTEMITVRMGHSTFAQAVIHLQKEITKTLDDCEYVGPYRLRDRVTNSSLIAIESALIHLERMFDKKQNDAD